MPVTLRPLDQLDAAAVAQGVAQVQARVAEADPTLDLRWGPLHNLLAYYGGVLGAQQAENADDYLSARSLLDIQADPTLADQETVDGVLSNFGVYRKAGAPAAGDVTVVVSSNVTLTLAAGTVFQAKGRTYRTPTVYTAKRDTGQINTAGDRLISPTGDGNYAFTVRVVADAVGAAGKLARGDTIVPAVTPPNYVRSSAAADFSGGTDTETNAEMLARLQQGVAAKAPSNRVNMAAMLRQTEEFARVVGMSIVGYGDREMVRDRHWVFPVSGGGKVDWYVRTQARAARLTVTKTCTCVSVDALAGTSVWQAAVGRDDAPGFFEAAGARPVGSAAVGAYQVVSDARGVDLSGAGWRPDVATAEEGAYSRFQTAVVRFRDTDKVDPAVGDAAAYDLELVYMPQVGDIHDTVAAADVRSRVADVLVKAPVPCFVTLTFRVVKAAGAADPDLDAVREAAAAEVNATPFSGVLYASGVLRAVGDVLPSDMRSTGIDMIGRLRYPDGATKRLRGGDRLAVPDDPGRLVSPRTVQFFADPADVGVTVETSAPPT